MKIACLLYGEVREFELAYKSWSFLKWPNIDWYFSFWKTSIQGSAALGVIKQSDCNLETITKIIDPTSYIFEENLINPGNIENAINQFYRLVEGLKLIENKYYDIIIVMRPDLYFNIEENLFKKELINCFENDAIGVLTLNPSIFCEDIFICFTNTYLNKFLKYNWTDKIKSSNIVCPQHTVVAKFLENCRVHILAKFHQNIEVVRPNCQQLESLNFTIVRQKFKEWNGGHLRAGIL